MSGERYTVNDNQQTGNAGLYLAAYRLTLLGWNVAPTARNARGVDLVAYTRDARTTRTLQVKALSKRSAPVPLGTDLDKLMGDFWIILPGVGDTDCPAFVMTPDEVRARAFRSSYTTADHGRVGYWLQPKAYAVAEFRNAYSRLGEP
jgi:hypothetical protein